MIDIVNSLNLDKSRLTPKALLITRLKRQLPYLAPVIIILLLWTLTTQILYAAIDAPDINSSTRAGRFAMDMVSVLTIFLVCLLIFRLSVFIIKKESGLAERITSSLKADPAHPLRWLGMLTMACVSFILIQTNFMAIKTVIPDIQPFYLDETLYELDRLLFFGRDPWTLFAWMFDTPIIIGGIDYLYNVWAPLLACVWMYAFISQRMPSVRRYQYIFGMTFLWLIGGNVLATIFASAGPCYYDVFVGQETYRPLMDLLAIQHDAIPLRAFVYQDYLMDIYINKNSRFAGISAAPSLHCATTVMLPIFFWKNKILRYLSLAFTIVIFIGSIVLAWHYVMDGLMAIPLVFFCWWLGGKLSRFIHTRCPSPDSPEPHSA